MSENERKARRRRWADILVIVLAIYVFVLGFYSPPFAAPDVAATEVERGNLGLWWALTAIGGVLALAGVFASYARATLGKALVAAGGLALLMTLFLVDVTSWYAWAGSILPGLLLLAAAAFVGPMPVPEEEGKVR